MKINDGSRPSRLELDRRATGETSGDVSDVSHAAALEAEKARVPPFDWAALQSRAAAIDEAPAPRAANRTWALWLAPVLALAAALFLVVRGEPPNRIKGEVDLAFYVLRGGEVTAGDPAATFREGDRLQFTYRSGMHDRLVLLSVDGDGRLTVYYPDDGETPVPVVPGDRHVLDGSIILDDAPGPETFLAFFGPSWSVSKARAVAEGAWDDGGPEGLVRLAGEDPDVAVLPLEKE